VETFPLGLADKRGGVKLKIPSSGVDSGLACIGTPLRFAEYHEVEVPVDTLDNILERKSALRLDLLKIDTEGCELFVLHGAEAGLRRFRPLVICEMHAPNTAQFGYHPSAVTEFMAGLGYEQTMISKDDALFTAKEQIWAAEAFNAPVNNGVCHVCS
jgi:hypothetical protein